MTEMKLRDYLKKDFEQPRGQKILVPVVLSDSKGFRLKGYVNSTVECSIVWWCKAGATIENKITWLKENIKGKLRLLGSIRLYVWLDTCNIFSKDKNGYISLTTHPDQAVDHLISHYNHIMDVLKPYPNCKITILDVPVYSIYTYNLKKKHKEPEKFNDQDAQLLDAISTLNTHSKEINERLQTCSPNWSRDLYSNTKHRSRTRILYNLNLYEDGLHPKPLLPKVWFRKLAQHIKGYCWI
jgi:hypothetical protein